MRNLAPDTERTMTPKGKRFAGRPRRRPRALVRAFLASGAAVLAGLSGAGFSYAFLTSTANAPGATLTAGTLTLRINGSSSASLGTFAVSPSSPAARAFSVANTGDAPAAIAAEIKAATNPPITSYARARITPVATSAACAAGLGGPQGPLNGYSAALGGGALAAGATRWYCLEVALTAGTPATVSGQGLDFDVTLDGTQSAS